MAMLGAPGQEKKLGGFPVYAKLKMGMDSHTSHLLY
jgi:hypothetical protein